MEYSIEEFDKEKTKVMNYIMYKKRTEYEVRNKFSKTLEENLLNDIIEYIKEAGYLSDIAYIDRAVSEFKNLNNLSRKEIKYKLYSKGIDNGLIEDYLKTHNRVCIIELWQNALKVEKIKPAKKDSNEISLILQSLGWKNIGKKYFSVYGKQVAWSNEEVAENTEKESKKVTLPPTEDSEENNDK